jgi:hypothetical protein
VAEIDVQEKRGRPTWVWLVGALAVVLLIWALVSFLSPEDRALRDWEATPAADRPAGEAVPPETFGDPTDPGADPAVPGATGVDPGAPGTQLDLPDDEGATPPNEP